MVKLPANHPPVEEPAPKDYLLTHDAGSGPYMITEFPLEEYVLMDKFSDWWGEFVDNAPDQFRMIATTEATTVRTLMSNGELDISDQWQTIEALESLDGIDGIHVAAFPNLTSFYLLPDLEDRRLQSSMVQVRGLQSPNLKSPVSKLCKRLLLFPNEPYTQYLFCWACRLSSL